MAIPITGKKTQNFDNRRRNTLEYKQIIRAKKNYGRTNSLFL